MRRASWMCLPVVAMVALTIPSAATAQARGDELTKFRNRETAVWESVKNKEVESIRKVFQKDYVAVYDNGIVGLNDEIDGISKMTIRDYRLSDVKVRNLDPSTVIVTSKVVVDGDANGQSMSGTYNSMTVWQRSGNQWYVAAHTEIKAR